MYPSQTDSIYSFKTLGHLLSVIKSVGKGAILTESVVLNRKK